ncbi:MAG: DEAD/DEAH box helicase [Lachnospiraceae bacterium]|nr:DEAD/DEAH box helicase [Lachnospiraceae bacterium]
MDQEKNVNVELESETPIAMSYEDSNVDERILRAVKEMGFEEMTPIQQRAIPAMLTGRDIIGQAQTGTGKTAAFGIPLLQMIDTESKDVQAFVICPTRELAMQAADELHKFAKYMHGIKILPVYGGQDIVRQIKGLRAGVQIVVGTPGRIMDHMRRKTIKTDHVKMVVLDEADEMLDMGFREDMETILKEMPIERQVALFSATMPKPILDITRTYQRDAEFIKVTKTEITVDLVKQYYYWMRREQKEEALCRLMDYYNPKRSLIFCNTKRMVDELAEHLKKRGYSAEGLHGDLSQNQRDTVMKLFKAGRVDILIATDVAARGIDINNVEAVFNFDVPDDIEYYVHRIGRTGRAGKTGRAFSLVCGRDVYKIRDIEKICKTKIEERKIPSVTEVTTRKADKILKEVLDTMSKENLAPMVEIIEDRMLEDDFTALDLAAAFLKQQMGEEMKELVIERSTGGRREGGNRGSYGNRGNGGRSYGGNREGGRNYGNRDGGRSYGGRSEGGKREGGYQKDGEHTKKSSFFFERRQRDKKPGEGIGASAGGDNGGRKKKLEMGYDGQLHEKKRKY